jgi:ribosomal protein S27E
MKIMLTVTCADCAGTGVDYDDNCRAMACTGCGGAGITETGEATSTDEPDPATASTDPKNVET